MTFSVSPTSVAPAGQITATGTGAKKRPARIRVAQTDPVMGNAILAEFTMPASGKFSRLINAPGGPSRNTTLVLQQLRTDNVWAQTADVSIKLLPVTSGGGGGTTPEPPNVPPTPPIANSGVTGSATGQTTATVQWTTSVAGTGYVEFGTSTAYGSQTASTSSGTSHSRNLTGLTPGQTYHYRVVSTDGTNTAVDQDRTFTTQAAATLPGAPTGLVATGGNAQVVLTWTAPANNGGSAITGYRIFRNGVSLTTDPASPYTDSTVTNGTSYTYTVAAITGVGEGPQSNAASATPAAAGDINPPIISNVVVSNITTSGFTVSWTTNEAATGLVEYGTGTGYGNQTGATSSGTSHQRIISGLVSQTTYHFRVRATDTAGNLAIGSDRTVTTSFVGGGTPYASVASISALKAALRINSNTEIVLTTDTYHVSPASSAMGPTGGASDALGIGQLYAARTNPVLIHPSASEVTLDGADAPYMGFMVFADGAHHQTWEGFRFANGEPTAFGVIVFGSNVAATGVAPHHITLNNIEFLASLTSDSPDFHDHGIYVADALSPGVNNVVIDDFTVTAPPGGIQSAVHFFHHETGRPNANNFTVRNMHVTGTEQAIMLADSTLSNIVFEDCDITDAERFAARYEIAATGIVLRRVESFSTGVQGYYSPVGGSAGLTFDGCHYNTGTKELVIP